MTDLENVVYIPYWLLIVLLFLSSGALQYALIGAVRLVMRGGARESTALSGASPVTSAPAPSATPALYVIRLDQARISDEDLRERTEGLR